MTVTPGKSDTDPSKDCGSVREVAAGSAPDCGADKSQSVAADVPNEPLYAELPIRMEQERELHCPQEASRHAVARTVVSRRPVESVVWEGGAAGRPRLLG